MYKGKSILAIIPARGGSKRLPGKNIKCLAGKPLISWTIESALSSDCFDEVMVNTDDQKIADIAGKSGASIPFLREDRFATDKASTFDVVYRTIEYYISKSIVFDIIVLLQPTSPLRDDNDIISALDYFIEKSASSVLSVCEVDHPIQWSNILSEELSMDNFIKDEFKGKRSQDLDVNYRLNGALYIWDTKEFMAKKESILKPSFAFIMNRNHSIDIDEEIDFIIAESIMGRKINK